MVEFIKALMGRYLPEREEEGQGLVEYALIIALIAIIVAAALTTLEGGISSVYNNIAGTLSG